MDKFELRNKLIDILKADTSMTYLIDSMMLTGTGIKYESEIYLDINTNIYYLYTTKNGNKLDKVFMTKDEALLAYDNGAVGLHAPIKVMCKGNKGRCCEILQPVK